MDPPFSDVLTSAAELRTLYRNPSKDVATKKHDRIQPWARAFIEASPFVFIATSDEQGRPTVSPKGGAPGFVTVLDERRLAIPDYAGNNLIDGLRNVVVNPNIGLIFLIPGRGETVRVDGRAWVTTQAEVIAACTKEHRKPKTAIGIAVVDMFIHCPSSFKRGNLWTPSTWRTDASASFVDFIRAALPPNELPDWAVT
jgi:hypothetical protein